MSETRRPRPLYLFLIAVGVVAVYVISYTGMTGCYTPSEYHVCMFDPAYDRLWLVALLASIPVVLTVLAVRKATEINQLWQSGQRSAARDAQKASGNWTIWVILSLGPLYYLSITFT